MKCQDSTVSRLKAGLGSVKRTVTYAQKVDEKADSAGSRLKDISREKMESENSDILMHNELDLGELFS